MKLWTLILIGMITQPSSAASITCSNYGLKAGATMTGSAQLTDETYSGYTKWQLYLDGNIVPTSHWNLTSLSGRECTSTLSYCTGSNIVANDKHDDSFHVKTDSGRPGQLIEYKISITNDYASGTGLGLVLRTIKMATSSYTYRTISYTTAIKSRTISFDNVSWTAELNSADQYRTLFQVPEQSTVKLYIPDSTSVGLRPYKEGSWLTTQTYYPGADVTVIMTPKAAGNFTKTGTLTLACE